MILCQTTNLTFYRYDSLLLNDFIIALLPFQKSNSESSRSSGERKQNSRVASFPTLQPSQGDVITYDDPAGRQERERILAQLKAASPSQDGFQSPTKLSSDIPVDQIEALGPAQVELP